MPSGLICMFCGGFGLTITPLPSPPPSCKQYMMSRKVTHTLFDATVVFALFPLSIAFVYVMENVANLN